MGQATSQPDASSSRPMPLPAGTPPPGCPMHDSSATPSSSAATPSTSELNPLNNMPNLAQAPSPGQKIFLPLERTISTIPRATTAADSASACPVAHVPATPDEAAKPEAVKQWEYPSPQQFYNALVRKGWETPEESIEMMVNIHNWLNEAAWQQVRTWEEKHLGGDRSSLAQFQGRPQDLSPKARYHLFLGRVMPSRFGYVKPFDRHDWVVHRPAVSSPSSSSYTAASSTQPYTTHRYVIDYYALPDDAEGNPVFSLDVRPAVDSPAAVVERVSEWWKLKKEAWGTGGAIDATPGMRVQEEK